MPRSPVVTRTARVADVPVLVGLWNELRQVGGRAERAVNPVAVPDISERLTDAIEDPACRIVVATIDDLPAGMAVLQVVRPDALSDVRVVQVMHVIVADGKRRRGVGHALLAAAADFADEQQIEHLTVGVYPSLRDASRFYARLGFAAMVVRRVAPVAVVRRRLSGERPRLRTEDVVRRRTRLRRPVPVQVAPLRSREPVD